MKLYQLKMISTALVLASPTLADLAMMDFVSSLAIGC